MDVRIDLYDDADAGAFAVETLARPEGEASPADLPGLSADVSLNGGAAQGGARSLVFRPAVSSPVGTAPLARAGGMVSAYLYHPKDDAEILAFDARITEEYSAYYAARGIYYTGTYHVDGPDGPCIGETMAYDVASREEADRLGNEGLSERIVAIEDECRSLQDLTRRRYLLWLTPRR